MSRRGSFTVLGETQGERDIRVGLAAQEAARRGWETRRKNERKRLKEDAHGNVVIPPPEPPEPTVDATFDVMDALLNVKRADIPKMSDATLESWITFAKEALCLFEAEHKSRETARMEALRSDPAVLKLIDEAVTNDRRVRASAVEQAATAWRPPPIMGEPGSKP